MTDNPIISDRTRKLISSEPLHPSMSRAKIGRAARDVLEERDRQISAEGWTPEHDDEHTDESLALVAALYAAPFPLFGCERGDSYFTFEDPWPITWSEEWDRRRTHDRRKKLVIAAALILAEIDRLDRSTPSSEDASK